MPKPEIIRETLMSLQLCIPDTWSDEHIEEFANTAKHVGGEWRWRIRQEASGSDPARNPCAAQPGHVHLIVDLKR